MTVEDDARAFLRSFRAAVQFAENVSGLTSLDATLAGKQQAHSDMQAKLNDLDAQIVTAQTNLDSLGAQIITVQAQAAAIIADAQAKADERTKAAEQMANKVVADAQAEVDQLKADALDLRNQLGMLSNAVSAKQAQLASTQSSIDQLKAKLNG